MNPSSHLASRPAYFLYGAIVIVVAVIVGAMFVSPLFSAKQQFATSLGGRPLAIFKRHQSRIVQS
jgi:hypothetical protein